MMLSQTINFDDCDLLGYPLVSEIYIVNDLHELLCLLYGLEFKYSCGSHFSSDTIGLPDGRLLLTFKYYDYDCREKTS